MIGWLMCMLACTGSAGGADGAEVVVYPPSIVVSPNRPANFLVRLRTADSETDCSSAIRCTTADPQIAYVEGMQVKAVSTGTTRLLVEAAGERIEIPIRVQAAKNKGISFRRDVIPVLTKSGCNSGGCHGAASGQDGFGLSLFGYDPGGDYAAITRHWVGRRIHHALPEESLLLKKAIATVSHTGGKRFDRDSLEYRTLARWIAEGATDDSEPPSKVRRLELYPPDLTCAPGDMQRLIVIAHRADGSVADVTAFAEFQSTHPKVFSIKSDGYGHATGTGESFLTARFDTLTTGRSVVVNHQESQTPWVPQSPQNRIDELVDRKLKRRGISPSPRCDDATFIRRLSIDLRGKLPAPDEVDEFVKDLRNDKRDTLIDQYLQSDHFTDLATMRWSERLKIRSGGKLSRQGVHRYSAWLRQSIADNVPLDQMAYALVGATGETANNPAGYFFQTEKEIEKQAENIAQIFLGMRLQCASCHNHPFDRWTMDDYYGFAAFLAQIGRKPGEDPREIILYHQGKGSITHPVSGNAVAPRYLGGDQAELGTEDPRLALAQWIANSKNDYFVTHMANVLWSWVFYRGIVDDPDDARVSNPPVNGPLLEYLAERLVGYQFDARKLLREICASRTYQSSSVTDPEASTLFAGQTLRPLPAAVLHDCIADVTGAPTRFEQVVEGTSAVQLTDGAISNHFLNTFGRSGRLTVCTCETKDDATLSQALHLLNGNSVHQKIVEGGRIKEWLAEGFTPQQIVERLFMSCISRLPSETEKATVYSLLAEKSELEGEILEDLFWSLINSPEFLLNH
ncbi:MAG: DUF1549 domain-containing protein [Planctomycetota bacterium]|nr:DUF1549 domain-containing protein [Planctomycetota bacterium]